MASERKMYHYTLEEVSKHDRAQDCWIIISDKVYDVTSFIDKHPGGRGALIYVGGTDATESFEQVGHGEDAKGAMSHLYIGDLHQFDHKPPPSSTANTNIKIIQQQQQREQVADSNSGDDQDYKNNKAQAHSH